MWIRTEPRTNSQSYLCLLILSGGLRPLRGCGYVERRASPTIQDDSSTNRAESHVGVPAQSLLLDESLSAHGPQRLHARYSTSIPGRARPFRVQLCHARGGRPTGEALEGRRNCRWKIEARSSC